MRVELRGVGKRFGKTWALRDVTLTLADGARVALIGPNGSGKSTLVRALLGMLACEGAVSLDGVSPFDARHDVARRLAYVPQIAPSLGATVEQVVAAVARVRALPVRRIEELADRLALDVRACRARAFRDLSGGMKQKLLLALALGTGASLFVLDEPTASLDADGRRRFFALFAEEARGATLVLSSHRLDEVRQLADHVVALDAGRLVFDGPVDAYLRAAADGDGLAALDEEMMQLHKNPLEGAHA